MKRTLPALAATLLASVASAGEVSIGIDTFLGGTKAGTCHATYFWGPADALKDYQQRQKERFEPVDPAAIERLRGVVLVKAVVVTYKQPRCAQNSGVPEKVVLTAKDGREPLLVVMLVAEEVSLKNLVGGDFTAINGNGSVALSEIAKLRGRELDFHLVYSDHGYKDKWKKDYADKILR